jgi:hypothetical protein
MQLQRSGTHYGLRSVYRATSGLGGKRTVSVKSTQANPRRQRAMQTIAPWEHFFVILPAGIQLGASRARAVFTTTSRARHIEMKTMLPIRIVCRVPPDATGRQARQASGRPLSGRAALVLAANTVKCVRPQVINNALIAPAANTATKMRPAA